MGILSKLPIEYRRLVDAGKFFGSPTRAVRLREERAAGKVIEAPKPLRDRLVDKMVHVEVGPCGVAKYRNMAAEQHPRRKNWDGVRPAKSLEHGWRVTEIDNGRYSSRCKYTHWTYRIHVVSAAWIASPTRLWWRFADHPPVTIAAPRGYVWGSDAHGIKLYAKRRPAMDYHPDSDDLESGPKHCVKMLRELAANRAAVAREKRHAASAVRKAEREGLRLCMADSIRAGNCRAGTLSWAESHGFSRDPGIHVRPSDVLKRANGDYHRVALVVQVGLRRHRQEMERGYALLQDHTLQGG